MTTLEEIARSIYERRNGPGCTAWGRLPHAHQAPYLADARAAVEATRDPDEATIQAACDATFGPDLLTPEEYHRLGHAAMLDHILQGE